MESFQQWQKVKDIVGSALEREASERTAFLDGVCSTDPELRAEVESLLAAHGGSDALSEGPWSGDSPRGATPNSEIRPYRLVRELGVGGMGQVWLAEQTEPVKRQVALKLIRAGMFDAATVQRFNAERQSLAIMDHPAIAKVFDAGTTATGQPYLVMEYVDGQPLIEYCDTERLSLRERLQLFVRVCGGVQHAHQKAIIHRDLKPSNILVVAVDGKPMPRIIDFGLAKAFAPLIPGQTLTQIGAFLGTPGYMSPEQADSQVRDIDTRSDVYSLGAILYELLTGFLPFDIEERKEQRLEDYLRRLREEDPPYPSTKVTSNRGDLASKAAARRTDSKQLVNLLRGDLDWVTMKALEKDRERRYATPSALAADLENYLSDRPVVARPLSLGYRAQKYVRQHAAGVAITAVALTLLVVAAIVQAADLRRITHERDRADRIVDFVTNMFKVSDPSEARGNTITAREILDKSSKEIDQGLATDPELQIQLLTTMGNVYIGLGVYSRAQTMFDNAIAIGRRSGATTKPATLSAMSGLASLLLRQGKYADAQNLLTEIVKVQSRVMGRNHESTLHSRRLLASTLEGQGRLREAETSEREIFDLDQRNLGSEHPETLLCLNELANIVDREGRMTEAEQLYREDLDILRRTLGPDHPQTLVVASNLAGVLGEQDRLQEAELLEREVLATRIRILGPEHPDTLQAEHTLANDLDYGGNYAEAEKFYRQILDSQMRILGHDHAGTLKTMHNLGATLGREGRKAEAEELQREALEGRRRVLGPDNPDTLDSLGELAMTLSYEKKFEEAQLLLSVLADVAKRRQDQEVVASAFYYLAGGAAIAGRNDQAIDYLRKSIDEGFSDILYMQRDPDLKTLHIDPRFASLISEASQRLATSRQSK
jgi:non-specific serine/threonine protein kinase/serine/threonine-protein kinase